MKTEAAIFIEKLKAGDTGAYTRIYDLYHEQLYAFILCFVKFPELAEDILQEVFLTLWRVKERIDSEQSLKAYLYKISRNCVFKSLKSNARQRRFIERVKATAGVVSQRVSDDELLIWKEYETILSDAIDSLPPQRKKIFQLCRGEGKSYDGVARELGISKNTVKEHLVLATRFIKQHVNKYVDLQLLALIVASLFL